MMPPHPSPDPLTAVGAGRLRSQRHHEMGAPQKTFAARTVVAVAGVKPRGAAPFYGVHAASRPWLSFFR